MEAAEMSEERRDDKKGDAAPYAHTLLMQAKTFVQAWLKLAKKPGSYLDDRGAKALLQEIDKELSAPQSAVAPLGYVWPDMVEWMEKSPLAQKGGTVNLHRLKEDPTMVPVYLVAQSASAALEEKPVAWLIERPKGTGKQQTTELEVVLSPLTDDTFMDEGDEAWPLYRRSADRTTP